MDRCTAPAVSGSGPSNIAPTGGASATISGLNFNSIDLTATALLGVSFCSSASWSTATMVVCAPASYRGGTAQIGVTLNRVVGTGVGSLSYDGAQVTHLGQSSEAHRFLQPLLK